MFKLRDKFKPNQMDDLNLTKEHSDEYTCFIKLY